MLKQVIEKESAEVEARSELVRKDEAVANQKASESQALKEECESDLAEAIPALEAALAALNTLKVCHVWEKLPCCKVDFHEVHCVPVRKMKYTSVDSFRLRERLNVIKPFSGNFFLFFYVAHLKPGKVKFVHM